jgi:hypothetical protein
MRVAKKRRLRLCHRSLYPHLFVWPQAHRPATRISVWKGGYGSEAVSQQGGDAASAVAARFLAQLRSIAKERRAWLASTNHARVFAPRSRKPCQVL